MIRLSQAFFSRKLVTVFAAAILWAANMIASAYAQPIELPFAYFGKNPIETDDLSVSQLEQLAEQYEDSAKYDWVEVALRQIIEDRKREGSYAPKNRGRGVGEKGEKDEDREKQSENLDKAPSFVRKDVHKKPRGFKIDSPHPAGRSFEDHIPSEAENLNRLDLMDSDTTAMELNLTPLPKKDVNNQDFRNDLVRDELTSMNLLGGDSSEAFIDLSKSDNAANSKDDFEWLNQIYLEDIFNQKDARAAFVRFDQIYKRLRLEVEFEQSDDLFTKALVFANDIGLRYWLEFTAASAKATAEQNLAVGLKEDYEALTTLGNLLTDLAQQKEIDPSLLSDLKVRYHDLVDQADYHRELEEDDMSYLNFKHIEQSEKPLQESCTNEEGSQLKQVSKRARDGNQSELKLAPKQKRLRIDRQVNTTSLARTIVTKHRTDPVAAYAEIAAEYKKILNSGETEAAYLFRADAIRAAGVINQTYKIKYLFESAKANAEDCGERGDETNQDLFLTLAAQLMSLVQEAEKPDLSVARELYLLHDKLLKDSDFIYEQMIEEMVVEM